MGMLNERPFIFTGILSKDIGKARWIICKRCTAENIDEFLGKQVHFKHTRKLPKKIRKDFLRKLRTRPLFLINTLRYFYHIKPSAGNGVSAFPSDLLQNIFSHNGDILTQQKGTFSLS